MKSRIKTPLFVLLILLLTSCNRHEKVNEFYKSGRVKLTAITINDSIKEITEYYPNGEIRFNGILVNNERNGKWIEKYSNGDIKWQGEYFYGFRRYHKDVISKNYTIQISPDSDSLVNGRRYYIRLRANNLHPDDIMISVNNGTITLSNDGDYDFELIPEKQGIETIRVYAKDDSGNIVSIFQKELKVW